jgi:hypothetical protein
MPKSPVIKSLARFKARLDGESDNLKKLSLLQVKTGTRLTPLPKTVKEKFAESAYLLVFAAWESFLEDTFLAYMCSGQTVRGYHPECFVKCKDAEHAKKLLRGDRRFVRWTFPSETKERAGLWFKGGEPYDSALGVVSNQLDSMRLVRNGIAHDSSDAREGFRGAVRAILGYVPRRLTPGSWLLMPCPSGFHASALAVPAPSFFDVAVEILKTTAEQIER